MDEKRQIQKELFEEFAKPDRKRSPKILFQPGARRTITLTYEHLIFIVMAVIITAAAFFSLGVERGKRLKPESTVLAEKKTEQASVEMAAPPKQIKEEPVKEEPVIKKEETPAQPKEAPKKETVSAYTVQVASYLKKDTADKEVLRLKKEGFEPFVRPSGKYYIVCVGEFKNKSTAASTEKKLRRLYPDCYVRKN